MFHDFSMVSVSWFIDSSIDSCRPNQPVPLAPFDLTAIGTIEFSIFSLDMSGFCVKVANKLNPPAPKVLGRDRPDGTRKKLQVYLGGGGHFFGQNLLFLIGRDARLQKTL